MVNMCCICSNITLTRFGEPPTPEMTKRAQHYHNILTLHYIISVYMMSDAQQESLILHELKLQLIWKFIWPTPSCVEYDD